jgi:type IV secretion system protein VirD4
MNSALHSRVARLAILAVCFVFIVAASMPEAWAQFDGSPYYSQPSSGELFATRFIIMLVAALFGFLIGAAFCPALRAFRRYAALGLVGIAVLYALFGKTVAADGLSYIVAIVLFFVALMLGLRIGARDEEENDSASRPTSLGSAKWATLPYLREHGVIGNDGFLLGEFSSYGQSHPLQYRGERHLLTVAPTRSGKGVSSIIPNLLTYTGSVFVIDPKGENALITAKRRGEGSVTENIPGLKQNVLLLDPWNIAADKLGMKAASFNPLNWIKAEDPDAAENAFLLADALVLSEAKDEARFWDEEAKALLMGIILYVGTAEEEAEHRTLGRVRDLLTLDDDGFKEVLTKMFNHPHPIVRSTAARQASKDTKLFSSVLATAQSHTHFLDSGRIRQSLSRSDFAFEDLKTKPTSIYLILPADRLKTFDRWLRLLIQQAITVNARNVEQKPEKPILFLLDEMPTLGRLPALEQAFGLMAGFGMQLWGIVQDLSQLAKVYGTDGWQTFISNSGVIQYFGSRDKMTAEYFSSLCGVTTVEIHNFSWAVGKAVSYATSFTSGPGGGSSSQSNTESSSQTESNGTNEAQRQLAYPDELMVLKGNQQIVFVENLDPIPSRKVRWFEHGDTKLLGINLHSTNPTPPKIGRR